MIGNQFEKHHLFRRLLIVSVMLLCWRVSEWSFVYAYAAIDKTGAEVAVVIGALTAPALALLGYAFKLYSSGRNVK